ncbi:hypothetical protein [Nocardioides sp.]|uniref:hypothetical protein n=1 Tax=Nocardioides sp. TaxID=35761 RepID=UPI003519CCBA
MSDERETPGAGRDAGPDGPDGPDRPTGTPGADIGSVGEEAMKLLGVFADLARQHGGDAASAAGAMAGQASSFAQEINDHLATDAAECRYCPICRVVHAVRQTSPDVRAHLTSAASSLLQAAAGLLETLPPPPGDPSGADGASTSPRGPSVERIDLDDGGPWDSPPHRPDPREPESHEPESHEPGPERPGSTP